MTKHCPSTFRYKKYEHGVFPVPVSRALKTYFINTGQIPNPNGKKTEETQEERIARIRVIRRQWEIVLRQLG